MKYVTRLENENSEYKEIPLQYSEYLNTFEYFQKLSLSETDSKPSLQNQLPTLCVSLIDTRGCKMPKGVPVQ
jgi:hypothetical protein